MRHHRHVEAAHGRRLDLSVERFDDAEDAAGDRAPQDHVAIGALGREARLAAGVGGRRLVSRQSVERRSAARSSTRLAAVAAAGRRGGGSAAGEARVVLRAQRGIGQRLVGDGQLRGACRRHFLEFGAEVDHLVGVIAGNLAAECLLDGSASAVGLETSAARSESSLCSIALTLRHALLEFGDVGDGCAGRQLARHLAARAGAARVRASVPRAQYGQNVQPGCRPRPQPGHAPLKRRPQLGHATKSSATGPLQPGQTLRISRTSVTTRSSSSAVVTPAFTLASASSPSVSMPVDCATSRIASSDARCAIMRRRRSLIFITS